MTDEHTAEPLIAEVDWREIAQLLAGELERWGWGDMHYDVGSKQDVRVRAVIDFYRKAEMQHQKQIAQIRNKEYFEVKAQAEYDAKNGRIGYQESDAS